MLKACNEQRQLSVEAEREKPVHNLDKIDADVIRFTVSILIYRNRGVGETKQQ